MELFVFNENSFDFNLIEKQKSQLGSNGIKKINKKLRNFIESDLSSSNNVEITVLKEENKSVKENEHPNKLNSEKIVNKGIMENREEVEMSTSSAENEGNVLFE